MHHIEDVFIASASNNHFLKLKIPPSQTWDVTGINKVSEVASVRTVSCTRHKDAVLRILLIPSEYSREVWFQLFVSP